MGLCIRASRSSYFYRESHAILINISITCSMLCAAYFCCTVLYYAVLYNVLFCFALLCFTSLYYIYVATECANNV